MHGKKSAVLNEAVRKLESKGVWQGQLMQCPCPCTCTCTPITGDVHVHVCVGTLNMYMHVHVYMYTIHWRRFSRGIMFSSHLTQENGNHNTSSPAPLTHHTELTSSPPPLTHLTLHTQLTSTTLDTRYGNTLNTLIFSEFS